VLVLLLIYLKHNIFDTHAFISLWLSVFPLRLLNILVRRQRGFNKRVSCAFREFGFSHAHQLFALSLLAFHPFLVYDAFVVYDHFLTSFTVRYEILQICTINVAAIWSLLFLSSITQIGSSSHLVKRGSGHVLFIICIVISFFLSGNIYCGLLCTQHMLPSFLYSFK